MFVAAQNTDTSHFYPYPIHDRYGDGFTWKSHNLFDLSSDTSLIRRKIVYDSATHSYFIIEKIDSIAYRRPVQISQADFLRLQGQRDETSYYDSLSRSMSLLNFKQPRPKPRVISSFFNRIFGLTPDGKKIDVTPTGNINLSLGYQGQNIKNPTLSEKARKTGSFDMNAGANMSIIAQIGNKLRLPISYNTDGTFSFNNQFKLNYQGDDDAILKSLQAGNISFQSKGTLMPSMQNLFGLEAQLHFGKLFVTGAVGSNRSQRQSITLQGGGLAQTINISLGDYDENRNFLLGNYFKDNYNKTMSRLPLINSQVRILRMEVWVTNVTGATTNVRSVVGLMDLGENQPYNGNVHSMHSLNGLPDNGANDLYSTLLSNSQSRNPAIVTSILTSRGLQAVNDFEQTYARKLDSTEYYYNPQAGFISLNQQLQPDQVLAVAYQYSYNGRVFQVGEFSQDVALDSTQGVQKVLFLKLLKATSQRVDLPTWQWMMKNVYSLNVSGLDSSNFDLNVYYNQPSGGTNRYLPQTSQDVSGKSIISILGADRLNSHNDALPDGQFDFIRNFTVLPARGRIIFPVLEPFGKDLDSLAYNGVSQDVKNQYIYYQLYDSIKAIANTYANVNRFVLQGTVKGSSSSTISIGGSNIPQGSVTVTAGGRTLLEGVDYTVDYINGTIQVLNQSILDAGTPVNVQFENNSNISTVQRNFLGVRLDYLVNKNLTLGATMEKLSEQPYTFKTNYGQDPINNTMYGVDMNYHADWDQLTRWLNKLPFYSTNAKSSINIYGEAAMLKPNHPKIIGSGNNGRVYIDDFESSSSEFDLRYPFTAWSLASTPAGNGLFPEADLVNNLSYGKNRALLAWYNIEPTLQDRSNTSNPLYKNLSQLSDPRVRPVYESELFPNQSTISASLQTTTFDLSFYPNQRGPYNFTDDPANIDANGHLLNPQKRWGGIMRALDQTDFETQNVEYIEFWMQDPFIKDPQSNGGKLVFDLGNVSEDVLKDGKHMYENGLATPTSPAGEDSSSVWGVTPANPIQLTNAFSNTAADRPYQDVGLDGMDDDGERRKQNAYLQTLAANFGTNSPVYLKASLDPSADNYQWYRDPSFTSADGILTRYKHYNNPQGNSPVATTSQSASTTYPDNEDLNGDNTINQTEQYYEYQINLKPNMMLTDKYVADVRTITPRLPNDSITQEHWYLFRIPIKEFTNKVGSIADFKSIRFMRMYLTGFNDSTTIRFAELGLVRNAWRPFTYVLDTSGSYQSLPAGSSTTLTITSVNTQDNSGRQPIPYKMPPGVQQLQSLNGGGSVSNGSVYLEKEQSMSLQIQNLQRNDSRSVFKNMNLDMRRYGQMSMFLHAESVPGQTPVNNNDLVAVIRIGQDFLDNYYEIRIPLQVTQPSATATPEQIWPDANHLMVQLQDLVTLKLNRNASGAPLNTIYREQMGTQTYSVKGNPNLAQVTSFLVGIENAQNNQPLDAEVWVDELSLSQMNEKGGWAAQGRVDMQLADLGTLSVSANTSTAGFGTLEQNVNERSTNDMFQFDASASIDAGKLFPKKAGFSIPFYAGYNRTVLTPQYDPYNQDVLFKEELKGMTSAQRDSARNIAQDLSTTKTFSFTNVRFAQPSMHPKIWSLSNFDFSYSYTQTNQTNPLIEKNSITHTYGGLGYTFNGQPKYWQPFRRLFHNKSPWLSFIRDFNLNPTPSLMSFRMTFDRQQGIYTPRVVNPFNVNNQVDSVESTYDNYFNMTRNYNLSWNLTRSLNIDFTANNLSVIDEPYGPLNTKAKKDSVWHNFLKGGRNTQYAQAATLSYSLPLNKLPFADWIKADYSYSATYNWIAANLQAVSLGNVIENGNSSTIKADMDFRKLYNKSRLLKSILNTDAQQQAANEQKMLPQQSKKLIDSLLKSIPKKTDVIKGLKGRAKRLALIKWRRLKHEIHLAIKKEKAKQHIEHTSGAVTTAARLLTMVKSLNISYALTNNSRLPGYMDSTRALGEDLKTRQPGFGYIFGKMPTRQWLDEKARQHVISTDSLFNDLYSQSYTKMLTINAELEPAKDLNIQLSMMKSFNKNYSELFKDTAGNGTFEHLNPYAAGGFTVSYASFKSLFNKSSSGNVSKTFTQFSDYRQIISQRLASANPYYRGGTTDDGYAKGYGRYAQNVLIPAFLAAYTGKSPYTVNLITENNASMKTNPLGSIFPLPNWSISYAGLSRIGNLSNTFSNITLNNTYSGTLAMNSFTSALNFQDPLMVGMPAFIDSVSGNYVPYFVIPNITISESFAPLVGINVTLANQSTFSFQYGKTRQLSLSLVDYQVSEVNTTSYALDFSLVKHNAKLPFLPKPKKQANGVGNDLTFGLNLAMSDQFNSNTTLDQTNNYSTGGQKVVSISPSINYVLNNRINLKFYFNQTRTLPYVSTTPPITTTNAGLQITMSLQ
ncbi:cell surface protein SprA [Arachidicoccus ginsenosidimutans]|uniref:T9SS outer membrane translocon Sov/SprA n=1 Tax=Arachidicoccus sp. BS20 TaxID=1850526 RepID=UPI0007F0D951|nr:cell surface protein SprA [Arachidicoccus sp. BS20]ANI90177.1 cell surface protein SprA [Arachidicoccus sp. BS20]